MITELIPDFFFKKNISGSLIRPNWLKLYIVLARKFETSAVLILVAVFIALNSHSVQNLYT